jgi:DNA-binding PadR family transcriptional regulator
MRGEALKGHLDLLVLAVLADGAKHGYAVIESLKRRSGEALDLPEGTVYPVLHRLEKNRLLESTWSVVGGRRRRTYELTAQGQEALADRWREWRDFSTAVSRVAEGVPWPATT